jgi:hypothetical protein
MQRKIADLYRADSCRIDNGSEAGMPIFGRFASIVRVDRIAVTLGDDGDWYISLPNGCTLCSDFDEQSATEHAESMAASGFEGWTTDREAAKAQAIEEARSRHNAKASESAAYVEKYGAAL